MHFAFSTNSNVKVLCFCKRKCLYSEAKGIFTTECLIWNTDTWRKMELLREVSSWFEPAEELAWQTENSTSGKRSFKEQSPVSSRFSESLFRDIPGTNPEQVRTCGFRRNSSSFDKAPKIRDSVRLNSWDSFLVTLSSISSDTKVMYSSVIPGTNLFRDWLFLAPSLETAANYCLFLSFAILRKKGKAQQVWRLN